MLTPLLLAILLAMTQATTAPTTGIAPVSAPVQPKTMTRVTYRYVSPLVKPGTFAAAPRMHYRWDDYHMRVEEAPDPDQRIHGVIISNNRDTWMINLFDKTAIHIHDDAPTYVSHAPIVSDIPRDHVLFTLELCQELAFMERHAKKSPKPIVEDGVECDAYVYVCDLGTVEMLVRKDRGLPWILRIRLKDQDPLDIVYDEYDNNVPTRPELFQVPEGIRVREAKPVGDK